MDERLECTLECNKDKHNFLTGLAVYLAVCLSVCLVLCLIVVNVSFVVVVDRTDGGMCRSEDETREGSKRVKKIK